MKEEYKLRDTQDGLEIYINGHWEVATVEDIKTIVPKTWVCDEKCSQKNRPFGAEYENKEPCKSCNKKKKIKIITNKSQ